MTVQEHLLSRHLNPALYNGVWIDEDAYIASFGLWNLSGKLVGFQQYRPGASKERMEEPRDMRYFSYVSRYGSKPELAVWGMESVVDPHRPIFITEGIFDASRHHWYGKQALAMLSNNPEHLRSWLGTLPNEIIPCVQGDKAGQALAKYATSRCILLPTGEDVSSLTANEYRRLFGHL